MEALLQKISNDALQQNIILKLSAEIEEHKKRGDRRFSQLLQVEASNVDEKTENEQRNGRLVSQRQQLSLNLALGGSHEASKQAHDLRYMSYAYTQKLALLKSEQALVASQILSMFALRLESQAQDIFSTLGLILPSSSTQLYTPSQPKEATNAALGYYSLLIDLVGFYFGGPQLSESIYQASRSVVYSTNDFWNRRPKDTDSVQPLYIEELSSSSRGHDNKGDASESDLACAFCLLRKSALCLTRYLLKYSNRYQVSPLQQLYTFLLSFEGKKEPIDISQTFPTQGYNSIAPSVLVANKSSFIDNDWVKL